MKVTQINMAQLSTAYLTIIGLNSLIICAYGSVVPTTTSASIIPQDEIGNKEQQHFKDFSYNLLLHSDLDEFSIEKGAAISSPFGVGYMLANINEKVWNVSNDGVGNVLHVAKDKVAEDYQALIEKMLKSKMSISSTLFTRDQNVSSKVPEGSRKIKTETKYVDFIGDWKSTWSTMNNKISNQTDGILNDQLIPKGGWWGGAFYYFTMGAFINTNHYKGSWDASWTEIGLKRYYDGLRIPFYEAEGNFPYLDNENYTAVAIKLKDGKSVVFARPKAPFVPFLKLDMTKLVSGGSPQSWKSFAVKKIQIPALNITLLDQHYKKLEALGVNYTFCVDETESPEVAMKKGPYFMGPIVQSHHVQFSPKIFQVATATASSVNSEEKMREEGFYSSPSGTEEESEGGQSSEGSEFVLPVEMDQKLLKALAEGDVQIKKVEVEVSDQGKNDTLSMSASSVEQVYAPAPNGTGYPTIVNSTSATASKINGSDLFTVFPTVDQIKLDVVTTTAKPLTTTQIVQETEILGENTVRFDRPFFWYLYDEEMGPLYYGSIHSLATYQKEYGIETEEDLWLYDAYKTLLFNCP